MTAPTIKCPKCKIDVPVDAIGKPLRCHKNCPLNEGAADAPR